MTSDGLRIKLEAGAIHVNPTREEVLVEIALLQLDPDDEGSGPGAWMCWRPGEDSFEHLT